MNKILVIATGWHFSSHFYENMGKQIVPESWEIDYFCVAHRSPENENTINQFTALPKSLSGFNLQYDAKERTSFRALGRT